MKVVKRYKLPAKRSTRDVVYNILKTINTAVLEQLIFRVKRVNPEFSSQG